MGPTYDNQNNLIENSSHYLQTAWSGLCQLEKSHNDSETVRSDQHELRK